MWGIYDTDVEEGKKDQYKGELINAFPTEHGDVSLDYTNSDAMSFAVTFTFDENILE